MCMKAYIDREPVYLASYSMYDSNSRYCAQQCACSVNAKQVLLHRCPAVRPCLVFPTATGVCKVMQYDLQEASRSQDEQLLQMQKELADLRQRQHDHTAQVRKVTAEAASQKASANYLINHLQGQLSSIQAGKVKSIQAAATAPTEGTSWTIEQATASVARILQVMATSQTE